MLVETWHVDELPAGEREDAWRQVISEVHLSLSLDEAGEASTPSPPAMISRRRLGNIDLVDTLCPPCSGSRKVSDLRRSPGEYVGVLVVHQGKEVVSQFDREMVLGAGGMVAWDSVAPLRFAVLEPSLKQTLLVPRCRFQQLFPRPELATARLVGRSPAADLFGAYLRSLAAVDLEPAAAAAAGNAALELLGAVLGSVIVPSRSALRHAMRVRVKEYIEERLGDPRLKPGRIAQANYLSLRSLYGLFEDEGDSVAAYVRRRRLARAHGELTRQGSTITDVAVRWGFADNAHFSRSFREQYGMTPSEARWGAGEGRGSAGRPSRGP